MNDYPPILSFFTGAGFLDIGFMQAGFNVVWHNEYDEAFVEGFNTGMESLHRALGKPPPRIPRPESIVDLGPNQILRTAFQSSPPECFGVIGGPPCPDFSVGGKNKGSEGSRGRLSEIYVDRILELRPTFFVFENVPGLLSTKKHRQFFDSLTDKLAKDFHLDLALLNALEYGAPQDRVRVFLVGFRKDWVKKRTSLVLPKPPQSLVPWTTEAWIKRISLDGLSQCDTPNWFPWPVDHRYINAKARFSWPEQIRFGKTPVRPPGIPHQLMVGSYLSDSYRLRSLPNGMDCFEPKSEKFTEIAEGDVSRKSFKRLHRWRYSPAAAYGNNEVHLHPYEARRLTVREAMRIQTVPDAFALPKEMTLSSKFKTIGNGVPVRLASAVAHAVAKILNLAL